LLGGQLLVLGCACGVAAGACVGDAAEGPLLLVPDGGAIDGTASTDAAQDGSVVVLIDAPIDAPPDDAHADAAIDSTTPCVPGPASAPEAGPATTLSSYETTCAVSGGSVSCWGWNAANQIATMAGDQFAAVAVPGAQGASRVAAGGWQICALFADGGAVQCFGDNGFGELGNGQTAGAVTGLAGALAIASGYRNSCAIRGDGTVACWGDNSIGQIGTAAGGTMAITPVAIPGVTNAVSLSTGALDSCAVRSDRSVICWGHDFALPTTAAGIINAVKVTVGYSHYCALQTSGTVVCWGSNKQGQLGVPDAGPSAATLPCLDDAIAIAAGYFHTCAVRSNGSVVCWGGNDKGQVGTTNVGSTVTSPVQIAGIDDAIDITAGNSLTCAFRLGGRVSCWGDNNVGALGAGVGSAMTSATPLPVVGL
jgi:alpha-tubulin suppressor-like RCC1 family protein